MTSTVLFRHLAYKEICVEQGYLKMLAVQQEYILVQRGYLLVQHDKGQCWQCYIESKNCPPLKHAFFKNKFHPETFLLNTIIVTLKTKAKTTNSSEAGQETPEVKCFKYLQLWSGCILCGLVINKEIKASAPAYEVFEYLKAPNMNMWTCDMGWIETVAQSTLNIWGTNMFTDTWRTIFRNTTCSDAVLWCDTSTNSSEPIDSLSAEWH